MARRGFCRSFWLAVVLLLIISQLSVSAFAAGGPFEPITDVSVTIDSKGTLSNANGVLTASVTSGSWSNKTTEITVTNNTGTKVYLTFTYTPNNQNSLIIDGANAATAANSTCTKTVANGGKITVKLTAAAGKKTATLTMQGFGVKEVPPTTSAITIEGSGTVTVDGANKANGSNVTVLTNGSVFKATPASGYTFLAWADASNSKILSMNAEETFSFDADTPVKAIFVNNTVPYFRVGTNPVFNEAVFSDLQAAINYVGTAKKTIVLACNGTLTGSYTIPANATLLIPFNSADQLYDTKPTAAESYTKPSAYRTLTMANGSSLTVKGALSVSAQQSAKMAYNGAPTGPAGFIRMNEGSSISVESGGKLYAWGFITGSSKASVVVKNGGKVYENFQITDWRGGSAGSTMVVDELMLAALKKASDSVSDDAVVNPGAFPISQYYVQNIEVPMTLDHGAVEGGSTAIDAPIAGVQTPSVDFIGSASDKNFDGMFRLESGSLTKWYDGATDRLHISVNGTLNVSDMFMNVATIFGFIKIDLDSTKYTLPVNSNITIHIPSGSKLVVKQDVCLLPGVEIIIDKGGVLEVAEGYDLTAYDADQWLAYTFNHGGKWVPVCYAPGKTYTREETDLKDARIVVNGTLEASKGAVYVTAGGADICSSGNGKANLKIGATTKIYQATQSGTAVTYVEMPIQAPKLKQETGEYFTVSAAAEYNYDHHSCTHGDAATDGLWVSGKHTITTTTNPATCEAAGTKTETCSCGHVDQETIPQLSHAYTGEWVYTEEGHAQKCVNGCGQPNPTKSAHTAAAAVQENVVNATCTTAGSYDEVVYCSVAECHYKMSTNPKTLEKIPHEDTNSDHICDKGCNERLTECNFEGDWVSTEAGHARKCSICGVPDTNVVAHNPKAAVQENFVDSTCYAEGSYNDVVYCNDCNYKISSTPKTVAKKEHTPKAAAREDVVDATCEKEGSYNEVVRCAVAECNEIIESIPKTIDRKSHDYSGEWVYTEAGHAQKCVNGCEGANPEVTAHTFATDWTTDGSNHWKACQTAECNVVSEKAAHYGGTATCVAKANCEACGVAYGEVDAKKHVGGTEEFGAVEGTCVVEGYTAGTKCVSCKAELTQPVNTGKVSNNHKNTENKPQQDPTCTEVGYTAGVYCNDCKNWASGHEEISAVAHNYTVKSDNVVAPATCNSVAVYRAACSVCGDTNTDKTIDGTDFDSSNHVGGTELRNDKAATCTNAGYTGDTYCLGCNTMTEEGEEIKVLGHNMEKHDAVDPDCETDGTVAYWTCSRCENIYYGDAEGETTLDSIVDSMLGHDYEVVDIAPDFGVDGYTTYTCKRDSSHTYTVTHEGTALVAVAQIGEQKYQTLADAVAAAQADSTVNTVQLLADVTYAYGDPAVVMLNGDVLDLNGCTLTGAVVGTISMNGGILKTYADKAYTGGAEVIYTMAGPEGAIYETENAVFVLESDWSMTVTEGNASLGQDWQTLPYQKVTIGKDAVVSIPEDKTFTIRGEVIVEGDLTCAGTIKLGYENASLTIADEGLTVTLAEGLGDCVLYVDGKYVIHTHDMQETTAAVAPKCEVAGKEAVYTCANGCGTVTGGKEIPALGHKMEETAEAVAPKCEVAGKTAEYTCANGCGKSEGGEEIPALGHKFSEIVEASEATCAAAGNNAYKQCTVCNLYFAADAATDATNGLSEKTSFIIPATGNHSFTNKASGKEARAATCTTNQFVYVQCDNCEAVSGSLTVAVADTKLDHDWADATCIAPKTCSVCKATEGDPTGVHNYVNGTCDVCGEAEVIEPDVTFANVNLELDSEILLRIKYYIPEAVRNDNSVVMRIVKNSGKGDPLVMEYSMADIRAMTPDSKGRYLFIIPLASAELGREVSVQFIRNGTELLNIKDKNGNITGTSVHTAVDYARLAFNEGSPAIQEMMKGLLVYGGYAQKYFGVDADKPVYDVLKEFDYEVPSLDSINVDLLGETVSESGFATGIKYRSDATSLDSAIYHKVNFNLLDGYNKDDFTYEITRIDYYGKEYIETVVATPHATDATRCSVEILNIASAMLDHMYTITITNNKTGEVYVVNDSVMNWIRAAMSVTPNSTKNINTINLAKAMYYYNQAANAYFGK